ncbi:hypothetical protein ACIQZB_39300 [Streptomyces sp. NPDC097727]|uniref:hypothetical protein n=1 Tax=Streptomyces sp. NPDC097727 TaxID=3366092 RepID=UPI0038198ABC
MDQIALGAESGRCTRQACRSAGPPGRAEGAGCRPPGFPNAEERQARFADKAKWLLQDRLVEIGADFQEGEPWATRVVLDRNLVTGRNPSSSAPLAAQLLKKSA